MLIRKFAGYCERAESIRDTCSRDPALINFNIWVQVSLFLFQTRRTNEKKNQQTLKRLYVQGVVRGYQKFWSHVVVGETLLIMNYEIITNPSIELAYTILGVLSIHPCSRKWYPSYVFFQRSMVYWETRIFREKIFHSTRRNNCIGNVSLFFLFLCWLIEVFFS